MQLKNNTSLHITLIIKKTKTNSIPESTLTKKPSPSTITHIIYNPRNFNSSHPHTLLHKNQKKIPNTISERNMNTTKFDITKPDPTTHFPDNHSFKKSDTPSLKYNRSKHTSINNTVRSTSTNTLTVDNLKPIQIHNSYIDTNKQ